MIHPLMKTRLAFIQSQKQMVRFTEAMQVINQAEQNGHPLKINPTTGLLCVMPRLAIANV